MYFNSYSQKKALNVDSPSFTPTGLAANATPTIMSSRVATAAPFTPRGAASGMHLRYRVYCLTDHQRHCNPKYSNRGTGSI